MYNKTLDEVVMLAKIDGKYSSTSTGWEHQALCKACSEVIGVHLILLLKVRHTKQSSNVRASLSKGSRRYAPIKMLENDSNKLEVGSGERVNQLA